MDNSQPSLQAVSQRITSYTTQFRTLHRQEITLIKFFIMIKTLQTSHTGKALDKHQFCYTSYLTEIC